MNLRDYLAESSTLLVSSADAIGQPIIDQALELVVAALSAGKPLLVCGNGGSASDAMHIGAELVGRFLADRRPFKVICLSDNPAFLTAWANDCHYDDVFARQVQAYGESDAVLLGISTSGRSKNIIAAFQQARQMGMKTIALTGERGGELASITDCLLAVPSRKTPLIQQVHICVYHYLCERIEERMCR